MNHDIKGCKNVGSKLPICPRREIVLEIWLTSLLPTYWAPPFYSISNKSLYKLRNSAQIGPKLPIFPKIYFPGKLTITFVCLLCSILQQRFKKKNLREQIIRQGCIILVQIGLDPVHQKEIFWRSWPTLNWSFISHHATFKKTLSKQIIRLHNFWPNCPLPQKEIF